MVKTKSQVALSYHSLLLFALLAAGMAAVQFVSPDLPDNDGFYHIKMAYIMRTEGLKPAFPWLPLTILNEAEFYDHHFLFHVALIPFTFGDLRLGAKWAAVLFSSLAFLAIWFLLHRQKIPFAWLWTLGLLGISDAFLYRMSVTRAQSLSLAVLALALTWMLERKYKRLGALAFVYVWMYDAFPLMFALAVLHFMAAALIERRLETRPLVSAAAGIVLGLVINPYFPANVVFSYRHMMPKLLDATSVRVGNEWYPYDTNQLLENSLPALAAFAGGVLALGLAGRKMDTRTALALLASLLFGFMLFKARRFVEYFPPFALIFAAFAWAPILEFRFSVTPAEVGSSNPSSAFGFFRHSWAAVILSSIIGLSITLTIPRAREAVDRSKPYDLYAGASAWLERNTPARARVFQTDWDDFPRLFYYNTHNTYLVGLDPTYMQLDDPALYDLWVAITKGNVANPSRLIAGTFGAQYVHSDLNHQAFLRAAEKDPNLLEVYRDDQAVIYQVVAPP